MPVQEISVHEARAQAKLLRGAYAVSYPEPGATPPAYLVVTQYGAGPEPSEMQLLGQFGWEHVADGQWRRVVVL
jgi:hypothetical protein